MVPHFPNLFLLTGPNTLPSGHSTLFGIECSVEYILRLLKPLFSQAQTGYSRIEVKKVAYESFNNWLQRRLKGLVYTNDVRSWYTDERTGVNTLIWPGSQLQFWWSRCVKPVQWRDLMLQKRLQRNEETGLGCR